MWLDSPHVNCSPTEPQELILTPGRCYKVTLLVSFPARPDGSHKPCSWLPLTAFGLQTACLPGDVPPHPSATVE